MVSEAAEGGVAVCCSFDCRAGRRSVKRRLHRMEEEEDDEGEGNVPTLAARVEADDEVAALREALACQQREVALLCAELEEERAASASAASEAMSMILRLQREKGEAQMEARQFQRFAEEKMEHDQRELVALEDLLYKREQAILALSCEVQGYRHRLLSYGIALDSLEPAAHAAALEGGDDEYGYLNCEYSQLCCDDNPHRLDATIPVNEMEKGVVTGQSPPRQLSTNRFGSLLAGEPTCSVEQQEGFHSVDPGGDDDNTSDRVYTIDAVHCGAAQVVGVERYVSTEREPACGVDGACGKEETDMKKLEMRLLALEADRESMRQVIMSMQSHKAQLVLLKEVAQHLCKDVPAHSAPPPERKLAKRPSFLSFMSMIKAILEASFMGSFSFMSTVKWIMSFAFWKKKADRSKHMLGVSNNNVGLLLLLDNAPRIRQWRRHSRMGG